MFYQHRQATTTPTKTTATPQQSRGSYLSHHHHHGNHSVIVPHSNPNAMDTCSSPIVSGDNGNNESTDRLSSCLESSSTSSSSNTIAASTDGSEEDNCMFPIEVNDDTNHQQHHHFRRYNNSRSNNNGNRPSNKSNRYSPRYGNKRNNGPNTSPNNNNKQYTKSPRSRSYIDFEQFQQQNQQLFEVNQPRHRYDYLVIIDFEATCDSGMNPTITRDNQEMIEFPFVVLDLSTSEIVHKERYYVKPIMTTSLTPFCVQLTGITDEILQKEGISLEAALQNFHNYVKNNFLNTGKTFCILTDSEWDIKGLLIREARTKGVFFESYFRTFYDLRKEYVKCYPYAIVRGLRSMVEQSRIDFIGRHHSGLCDCFTIAEIVKKLLNDGHIFDEPVTVSEYYDPFRDNSFGEFIQSYRPLLNTVQDYLEIEASLSPNRRYRALSQSMTSSPMTPSSCSSSVNADSAPPNLEERRGRSQSMVPPLSRTYILSDKSSTSSSSSSSPNEDCFIPQNVLSSSASNDLLTSSTIDEEEQIEVFLNPLSENGSKENSHQFHSYSSNHRGKHFHSSSSDQYKKRNNNKKYYPKRSTSSASNSPPQHYSYH
ncbi:hypothetical protein C9374_008351 [Naegleria lovaniensis]|uniref:Exonuclease domain-containing protein n=1 Tax=Naegleria lovaniensis TaxID=51637 RepID=A0AA88KHU9_NAELO|nr:uncharacterized protein C9374_008351 [Naegleria lovaniensis]KAG2378208.1 hypothetical protein C9374_008351 [Naegleria lovaniensis]